METIDGGPAPPLEHSPPVTQVPPIRSSTAKKKNDIDFVDYAGHNTGTCPNK